MPEVRLMGEKRDKPMLKIGQLAGRLGLNVRTRLPMVLVDGKPLECCHVGPVTEAALRAAGVGKA
jgi:hypothetical protein